jgi:hypothetical protein
MTLTQLNKAIQDERLKGLTGKLEDLINKRNKLLKEKS